MKKIEINLYPYQPKEENEYIKIIEKYTPFVLLGGVGLVTISLIFFFITASMSFPYHKLSSEWNKLQPKISNINGLKKDLSSLAAKKKAYRGVLKHKMNVAHILADVYASLPKNIWLSQITFEQDSLCINGYAVEWKKSPLVSTDIFAKHLRRAKYLSGIFSEIRLRSSRKTVFNTKEVMRFEIKCRM